MPTNKKSHISAGTILSIGAGLAALGATTYYLFGPKAKANQKKLKGWMIKMKGEIIEKLETTENVTEENYHAIIDTIAATYKDKINSEELDELVGNLKRHWHDIVKLAHKSTTKAVRKIKAAVK